MFRYFAFNIQIASELEIPEFVPASGNDEPDVEIRLGSTPDSLEGDVTRFTTWQAKPREYLLEVPDKARFHVVDGRKVIISVTGAQDAREVRGYLLGSAIAALLQQRRYLPLHASAVSIDGKATFFLGRSGSGKSTMMNLALETGCLPISDDLSAIQTSEEGPAQVVPSFPRTRLWESTAKVLDYEYRSEDRIRDGIGKYSIPVESLVSKPVDVSRFLLLTAEHSDAIEIEKLSASEAFKHLRRLTFRSNFILGMGMQKMHFEMIGVVSRQAEFFALRRPFDRFDTEELKEVLKSVLKPQSVAETRC